MRANLSTILQFKNGKKRPKEEGGIPVYGGNGILGYTNAYNNENCLVIGRVGAYCGSVYLEKNPCWVSDNAIAATIKENTDIVYAYYVLKSQRLNEQRIGTSQPLLTQSILNSIETDILPYEKQVKVGRFLDRIDNRIELNKRINENLAEQADALYQAFFSPKSGTQGKNVTLDEYCSIFTGKKNANASVEGGKYKFFTCAPESLLIDSYIYDGNAIIVSGNGAYTGRTRFYSGKFDLYQRTYACTLLDGIDPDYIFPLYWFVKLELSKKIMGGTRGSAIPYIVMNDLAKFEFIYNEETFVKYMPIFKDLTETIQANEFENEHLSELRDTLLPRLMSGELDVSELDL